MQCVRCALAINNNRYLQHEILNIGNRNVDHFWLYDFSEVREIILKAKYYKEFAHLKHLAKYCAEIYRSSDSVDQSPTIVRIPSSLYRIKQRGFDHSKIISNQFAKTLRTKQETLILQAYDFQQTGQHRLQRIKAPKYMLAAEVKPKNYLLIDDVATSRSSIRNCAQILYSAGANKVSVITLAYTKNKKIFW